MRLAVKTGSASPDPAPTAVAARRGPQVPVWPIEMRSLFVPGSSIRYFTKRSAAKLLAFFPYFGWSQPITTSSAAGRARSLNGTGDEREKLPVPVPAKDT
jgi:hypothetical protein